jgi:hypothetical protein
MPWSYNVGSGTPPNYTWYGLNTGNQHVAQLTIPTCAITNITVYAAGHSGAVLTRLGIWLINGGVVAQSDSFTMGSGSEGAGGQAWQTVAITPRQVDAGDYWVGLYRNPSGGHIMGTTNSGVGTGYYKTNTNGFPAIQGMDGYSSQNKCPYVGIFYITVPTDISSASVTRNSDTSHTLNWTNHSSSDQPYDNIWVDRWDNVTNGWYNLSTISGSNSSYTDTTTTENRQYRYRVLAYNSAGNTGNHTYTDYIKTTPAAPTNVVATRNGTSVDITWSNNTTIADNMKIQKSEGAAYSSWVTLDLAMSGTATSKTDTSPYAISKYRVWASVTTGSLNSAYVYSNEVITIQAPSAPTNLNPNNLSTVDVGVSKIFTWQHNPLDSSAQTKFSLRYRIQGAAWPGTPQYNQVTSSISNQVIPASTFTSGQTYEWQVCTKGSHADFSSWSATGTFVTSTKPTATITSPGYLSEYSNSLLTVTWDFNDADSDTQIQADCYLYSDSYGALLEKKTIFGSDETMTLDYNLINGTRYYLTVWVLDDTGLWSSGSMSIFDVVFNNPAIPTIEVVYNDDQGCATIEITNPSPIGDEEETSYNQLFRSIDGLTYELVLDDIPINTTVTDYLPLLNGTTYYFVRAVSTTPTTADSYIDTIVNDLIGVFFINGGDLYSDYVRLIGDVDTDESLGRNEVLKRFAGRTYPVKYQGEELNNSLSFSCDLPYINYQVMSDIINSIGDVFYRDWRGRYFKCSLTGCKLSSKDQTAYQFSCTIVRLDN